MAARNIRFTTVLVLILLGLREAPHADRSLITSFQRAFQPTTPAPGWSYLWNNAGPIGNPANYTPLLSTAGGFYTSDGSGNLPAAAPGAWVNFGLDALLLPGGHPGTGALQSGSGGIERYAIAVFTLASADSISIVNGLLRNRNPNSTGSNSDGLNLKVFVNDNSLPVISVATAGGFGSEATFDGALGGLIAGDRIYVAIGSKDDDSFDGFALEYDIVSVPEPNGRSLFVIAAGLALIVARHRYQRCKVVRFKAAI